MVYIVPAKVNIRNIRDIHAEFLTYANNSTAIEIDLDGCEESDLSLIQLIESARKTAAADSKNISLTKPANDIVLSTLRRAGMFDAFSAADTKFWLQKEEM